MEKQRKLKLGMVGGGRDAFIGAVHRMAAARDGLFELVAGALSATPERALASGRELGLADDRNHPTWQELIAREAALPPTQRLDLVAIVTPNHTHHPIAMACLEAGFNVICDKPMTTNLAQALELADRVGRRGTLFALTHNYTGYPMVKQARHLVEQGELGRLMKVVVEYPQDWLLAAPEQEGQKQAAWRTDPARAGASCCMADIGSHCENLVHYVTGLEVESICADLGTLVPGRQLDDDGVLLLRFREGARGILHASQVAAGEENGLRLRVYGEKAGLDWHQERPDDLWLRRPGEPAALWRRGQDYLCPAARRGARTPPGHPEGFVDAFANIYRNVGETLIARRQGREPDPLALDFPGVEAGVRGMAFIETVLASAASAAKWTPMPALPAATDAITEEDK